MWVRTQDKLCLTRVDALPIINHDEGKRLWSIIGIGKFQYKLGSYKSKERALEVLDEIDSKIMMNKVIEIYSNLGDLTFANRANYTYTPIYQMPNE